MRIRIDLLSLVLACLMFGPLAHAGKLTDALAKLSEKEWPNQIERMDEDEIEDLVSEVDDVADDIDYDNDENWRNHILDTWGEGESESRRHISKCPYCRGAAVKVAQQAGLPEPRNRIPQCFIINGRPYGAGSWGELYPLNPQTGGVAGGAEGSIWFQGGRYIGINLLGQAFNARPCQ